MTTEEAWTDRVLVRWMMTQWCNYSCWYCRQDHSRKQEYKGRAGHWADNASPLAWFQAFDKHFSKARLTLLMTGGEPMLDRKNVFCLYQMLIDRPWLELLHVDTNGSWDPASYPVSDKVRLKMSWHPSEIDDASFLSRLDAFLAAGWQVPIVSLVVDGDRAMALDAYAKCLDSRKVAFNVIPIFGERSYFTPDQTAILKRYISSKDWPRRFSDPTFGDPCLFPSIAYEMEPGGQLRVGCHKELSGDIFADELPVRLSGYTPCPDADCFCVDKYSFMKEQDGVATLPAEALAGRIPLRMHYV
jgi:hypothetical protein